MAQLDAGGLEEAALWAQAAARTSRARLIANTYKSLKDAKNRVLPTHNS
ncbi:hypothetical protein [Nostoc sp.]